MPRWDFSCQCGHIERDVTSAQCDPDSVRPQHCGQPMDIDWNAYRTAVENFEPFVTTNMRDDGKPITIQNSADLKRYQTQYGVYQVSDPALKSVNGKFVRVKESPKGRVIFT